MTFRDFGVSGLFGALISGFWGFALGVWGFDLQDFTCDWIWGI